MPTSVGKMVGSVTAGMLRLRPGIETDSDGNPEAPISVTLTSALAVLLAPMLMPSVKTLTTLEIMLETELMMLPPGLLVRVRSVVGTGGSTVLMGSREALRLALMLRLATVVGTSLSSVGIMMVGRMLELTPATEVTADATTETSERTLDIRPVAESGRVVSATIELNAELTLLRSAAMVDKSATMEAEAMEVMIELISLITAEADVTTGRPMSVMLGMFSETDSDTSTESERMPLGPPSMGTIGTSDGVSVRPGMSEVMVASKLDNGMSTPALREVMGSDNIGVTVTTTSPPIPCDGSTDAPTERLRSAGLSVVVAGPPVITGRSAETMSLASRVGTVASTPMLIEVIGSGTIGVTVTTTSPLSAGLLGDRSTDTAAETLTSAGPVVWGGGKSVLTDGMIRGIVMSEVSTAGSEAPTETLNEVIGKEMIGVTVTTTSPLTPGLLGERSTEAPAETLMSAGPPVPTGRRPVSVGRTSPPLDSSAGNEVSIPTLREVTGRERIGVIVTTTSPLMAGFVGDKSTEPSTDTETSGSVSERVPSKLVGTGTVVRSPIKLVAMETTVLIKSPVSSVRLDTKDVTPDSMGFRTGTVGSAIPLVKSPMTLVAIETTVVITLPASSVRVATTEETSDSIGMMTVGVGLTAVSVRSPTRLVAIETTVEMMLPASSVKVEIGGVTTDPTGPTPVAVGLSETSVTPPTRLVAPSRALVATETTVLISPPASVTTLETSDVTSDSIGAVGRVPTEVPVTSPRTLVAMDTIELIRPPASVPTSETTEEISDGMGSIVTGREVGTALVNPPDTPADRLTDTEMRGDELTPVGKSTITLSVPSPTTEVTIETTELIKPPPSTVETVVAPGTEMAGVVSGNTMLVTPSTTEVTIETTELIRSPPSAVETVVVPGPETVTVVSGSTMLVTPSTTDVAIETTEEIKSPPSLVVIVVAPGREPVDVDSGSMTLVTPSITDVTIETTEEIKPPPFDVTVGTDPVETVSVVSGGAMMLVASPTTEVTIDTTELMRPPPSTVETVVTSGESVEVVGVVLGGSIMLVTSPTTDVTIDTTELMSPPPLSVEIVSPGTETVVVGAVGSNDVTSPMTEVTILSTVLMMSPPLTMDVVVEAPTLGVVVRVGISPITEVTSDSTDDTMLSTELITPVGRVVSVTSETIEETMLEISETLEETMLETSPMTDEAVELMPEMRPPSPVSPSPAAVVDAVVGAGVVPGVVDSMEETSDKMEETMLEMIPPSPS